jgi:hypothetical protein
MTSELTEKAPSSMDLYRRVMNEASKEDITPVATNEVRITGQGKMKNYIEYATNLFEVTWLLSNFVNCFLIVFYLYHFFL